jgi:hypothetical protein
LIINDDSRLIDVSQHEPVDRIRRLRGAEARGGAGERVRAAFWFIALQQRGAGPIGENAGELPSQVVDIGDTAIHTQPAHRCGDVRSVPGEEDTADLVAVGDERGRLPDPVADVPQLDAVDTEATADELDATVLGERFAGLSVRIVGNHAEPTALVVDRGEQRSRPRFPEPVHRALAVLHPHFDVGLDEDADAVAERARTGPTDA